MGSALEKPRCGWARGTESMLAYHDREWGVPRLDDRGQFEFLVLESAQAGLSWRTILERREGYRRCFAGFDPEAVSWAFGAELARELSLLPCRGLVERLRRIKDEAEVACLRRSFALNHALLEWIPGQLKEGMAEAEAAWLVERYFREHGASELAFPSIVAFGPNGALPHAVPGETKLRPEMPVLFDVGCRVDGYCSDQTRSFWFGEKPSPEFQRARDLVAEAQDAAIRIMRPGLPMCDAYHAANAVFERAGCAGHFTHSLGHGVGLDTHEQPSLSRKSADPLEAGMTVTVEPGLYYPGLFGVRLEYTTLIVAGGAEVL